MKVATILVPLTEVLSIYRNASLLSGGEKMDFTVFLPFLASPMVLVIIERIKYNIFYENLTGRDLHGKLSESGKFFISWKSSF